ncbi:MAG: DUF349 domain-containing protein [Microbacterium sp.]|nr:DUF349 domain-containing protein [Microbacterium sp.]
MTADAENTAEPTAPPAEPDRDAAAPAPAVDAPETDEAVTETVEDSPVVEVAPAADAAAPSPAVPTPSRSPVPAPLPRPTPGATARVTPAAPAEPWGRVDDDGTVLVREGSEWRVVGEFPDGTREEALAYFERKYADLASEVTLLEVRHRRGGAAASDLRSTAAKVQAKVSGAAAVGDLAALEARLAALVDELSEATAAETAAAREAVDAAIEERTRLVERMEALAARDPRSIQWKQTTADVNALFEEWQTQQQRDPRLPKSTAQQLWKRFRDARGAIDKHRREFYAELDETHKSARDRKTRLVERAEALAPKGEDGIAAYRDLLEEWKSAGRAGKKVDDALWARFKAAGDALYGARADRANAEVEASREKIEAKRELLSEAAAIPDERDLAKARTLLTSIQRRWDEIGRVFPREQERALDDELRKIEQGVRGREDADWKRNNPETKARANDMTRQLTDAIAKLEAELASAEKTGDKKAIATAAEALEARKSWLRALGG